MVRIEFITFLFAVLKTFIVRINYLLTKKDKWLTLERKTQQSILSHMIKLDVRVMSYADSTCSLIVWQGHFGSIVFSHPLPLTILIMIEAVG